MVASASATQIASEQVRIDLRTNQPAEAEITREYTDITTEQISFLVPSRYAPGELSAQDEYGELDCTVDQLDIGKELLCTPRQTVNYTVTMSFTGDFLRQHQQGHRFTYIQHVLTPTDSTELYVTLPEGYGILSEDETPYSPSDATVGSEGRQIFLQWSKDDVQLGERTYYVVKFEELQRLEQMSPGLIALVAALLVAAAVTVVYVKRRDGQTQQDTIASVFPVLKDDEQTVLRYIIDQGGEVEQRDIVQNVSYSKAKVSKLLSDLEDRHLIEKEKQGRVNVVKLLKDVGDFQP